MAAKIIWGSLALTPAVFVAHYLLDASGTVVFALAAAALIPLAWLIGEATEHVAEHTGPGIGGFVNASFGNAPGADHRALRSRRRRARRRARLDHRLGRLESPARPRGGDDRRRQGAKSIAARACSSSAIIGGRRCCCSSSRRFPASTAIPTGTACSSLTIPVALVPARALRRRSRCSTCGSTAQPTWPWRRTRRGASGPR